MDILKPELERLIKEAMGEIEADLIVTNGKVVNVYSGEILDVLRSQYWMGVSATLDPV